MAISTIGIIGAGTMGAGITMALASHGFDVSLFDQSPTAADAARSSAGKFYARNVEKGRMSAENAAAAEARIRSVVKLDQFADCDLLIEAVFEDFDLKAELFGRLSAILRDDTIVATNTSCLRVSDLARHMLKPERFLGMHYFSPAQINPIVEIVKGEKTNNATMSAALSFTRAHSKQPITCKDSFGFAINRFFCPYTNEAARLLDEGLGSTAQIDEAAKDAVGAAAGPFLVMNLIKPRINLHAIRNLASLGPFYEPANAMIERGEASAEWDIGKPESLAEPDRQVLIDRLRAGAFLPVLQALDESVAEPKDFDLGATQALKFGKPPCALMDELGADEVKRILEPVLQSWSLEMPKSIERVGTLCG